MFYLRFKLSKGIYICGELINGGLFRSEAGLRLYDVNNVLVTDFHKNLGRFRFFF